MGDTCSRILESSREVWQLERAQILINIEEGMTSEERHIEQLKYQLNIKDELYLQVYKVDDTHFGRRLQRVETQF